MRNRWLTILSLVLTATASRAEYPTLGQAGFHHCALIYEAKQRGPAELAPYVANPDGWLFDAFLFLDFGVHGKSTMVGVTVRDDWQYQLDQWFAPGRDLAALDEAIEQAGAKLGKVSPRQIILSIPHPARQATDFGDVGRGHSEDLSTPEGQTAVARWYVEQAGQRFAAAHYRHLALWGFYWMNEGIGGAEHDTVRRVADAVHAGGQRLFWIPYYGAESADQWREVGIDLAVLQPNYAFLETHQGELRRNRLAVNAQFAREHGLGVEIELPMTLAFPGSPRMFREYLRDGAADRYGYQLVPTAYYLGSDWVERLARSDKPEERSLYDDLAAYVQGRTVAEPNPDVTWTADGRPAPPLGDHQLLPGQPVQTAEAHFPARELEAVEVYLDEPEASWQGTTVVEGQTAGGWAPAGWAIRPGRNAADGRWQVLVVPVSGSYTGLRLRFEGGGQPPKVAELNPIGPLFGLQRRHLAWRAPYQVTPPEEAIYPDRGGVLTDGEVPAGGFAAGRSVGWMGDEVAVRFDLGEPVDITGAEACMQGGGYAAVRFPRTTMLQLSTEFPPPGQPSGAGALPRGYAWAGGGEPVIDRRRADADFDGRIPIRLEHPVRARYATFIFQADGWLMLTELRLFSGERNLLAGRPYRFQPAPRPKAAEGAHGYPDDGRKLTDGLVAPSFSSSTVVGWIDRQPHAVTVDLGRRARLDGVVVWSVTGSRAGIWVPARIGVALSDDGESWRAAGDALPDPAPDEPSRPCAVRLRLAGAQARWLRLTVPPGKGWSMLSEVEVNGDFISPQ